MLTTMLDSTLPQSSLSSSIGPRPGQARRFSEEILRGPGCQVSPDKIASMTAAATSNCAHAEGPQWDPSRGVQALPAAQCIPSHETYSKAEFRFNGGHRIEPALMLNLSDMLGRVAISAAAEVSNMPLLLQEEEVVSKVSVQRLLSLQHDVMMARIATATPLQNMGHFMTKHVTTMIEFTRDIQSKWKAGTLGCHHVLISAKSWKLFSRCRDRSIAYVAFCEQSAAQSASLVTYYKQLDFLSLNSTSLCLGDNAAMMEQDDQQVGTSTAIHPVTPDIALMTRLTEMSLKTSEAWSHLEHSNKVLSVCGKTFIESLDRLLDRSFLGMLSPEFVFAWSTIWIQAWEECLQGFAKVNTAWQCIAQNEPKLTLFAGGIPTPTLD